MAHHERMLRRGINIHALVGDIGDGDIRFHRVGIGHGKIIVALDHRSGFFECLLDIAPLNFMRLANIVPFAGGDIALETAQRAGFEFSLVQERRVFGHRLFGRKDAFQLFILDVDQFQRFERRPFIDRHHRGHRLAGVANFVDRQQRVIFDRVAEVGIQAVEIVAGNHAVNSGMRFGFGFVDGNNFRVGEGAAQHFGVGHADQPQVGDVLRFAGDFDPAVAARDRMIDDVKIGFLFRAHLVLSCAISLGSALNRRDDGHVAGAAADIAVHVMDDLIARRFRIFIQQRFGRHDHAGRAEAALKSELVDKRLLDRMERAIGFLQAFDR